MKDGIELSSKVWMPKIADKKRLPAIIEYIPYRKRDGTIYRDELIHPYFANNGYIAIRIDMRGSGDSDGVMLDEYTIQEQDDAITAIKWIAKQDWCNGNIGMMGKSWGGFNSLQIASIAPKQLKAIITAFTSVDRFSDDIHYKGGCLLGDNLRWGAVMLAYSARPPDPLIVGKNWKKMWMKRLKIEPFLSIKWLKNQRRNNYWKHGSVCENYSSIRLPVLAIGGWADNYMNAPIHLLKNMNAPIKAIIGPWGHQYPHMAVPGPQINFLEEMKNWWDYWLKGIKNGVNKIPDYRFWIQDSVAPKRYYNLRPGNWQSFPVFPSDRIKNKIFFLGNHNKLKEKIEKFKAVINSPTTCGLSVGEFFPMSIANNENTEGIPELPGDQRIDDAYSICFDSDEFKKPFSVVGSIKLILKLKVDKPIAQLFVRLCDINQEGSSTRLSHGMLNLNFHKSFERPRYLNTNKIIKVEIILDEVACRFNKGHKIRIAISNNYWPFVWPSPELSKIDLFYGKVIIPSFRHSFRDEYKFKKAEKLKGWNHKKHKSPSYKRIIENDLNTGNTKLRIFTKNGRYEDLNHGLITESELEEIWKIHPSQPLSAEAEINWVQIILRDNWKIKISSGCIMTSSKKSFFLKGYIFAEQDNEIVFEKYFNEEIPRNYR